MNVVIYRRSTCAEGEGDRMRGPTIHSTNQVVDQKYDKPGAAVLLSSDC